MATTPEKEVRYIAVGYAAYALMFLAMGWIVFSYTVWPGFQQFLQDLEVAGDALLLITGGFVINAVMAVGSWKILSFQGWKRKAVLFCAVAIAAIHVLNVTMGIIAWARGSLPLGLENIKFISALGLAVGYVFLAGLLLRTAFASSKQSEQAQ